MSDGVCLKNMVHKDKAVSLCSCDAMFNVGLESIGAVLKLHFTSDWPSMRGNFIFLLQICLECASNINCMLQKTYFHQYPTSSS